MFEGKLCLDFGSIKLAQATDITLLGTHVLCDRFFIFFREALASPGILNCPERVNWKDCSISKPMEVNLAVDFKEKFNKYDFTLDSTM